MAEANESKSRMEAMMNGPTKNKKKEKKKAKQAKANPKCGLSDPDEQCL